MKSCVLDKPYDILVIPNFTIYEVLKANKLVFNVFFGTDKAKDFYKRFNEKIQSHHKKEKVYGCQF